MSRNYYDLYDEDEAEMLQDADNAITVSELWTWLADFKPEDGKGFMFSNHPNLDVIQNAMKYTGHSGSSYGWTMRQMEFIAKEGWDKFRSIRLQKYKPKVKLIDPVKFAEAFQNAVPNGKQQYQAIKDFSEGKLSYAEMRALCG